MNAILDAPTLTEEIEEQQAPPGLQTTEEDLSLSPTTFAEPEALLGVDPLGQPTANPQDGFVDFPLPENPDASGARPDAKAAGSVFSWAPEPVPQPSRQGLSEEFDDLYHTYERRVYRQCYRMVGNPEDAEDLTQEVFLQLFRKADTFRGEASFSTWLHRLTVNTVLMHMRRFRRWRGGVSSLDSAAGGEDWANDVSALASALPASVPNPIEKISLDIAIAQLADGYKEIFLLHDRDGYQHDEIAKLLGINEGTSKSQLHKARVRLRNLLESKREGVRH